MGADDYFVLFNCANHLYFREVAYLNKPTSCKLFHYTYTIEYKNDEQSRLRGLQAEIDHNLHKIWINEDMPLPLIATSLLHEIAHAVYFIWYGIEQSNDERVAIVASEGMMAFINQNPDVWYWIQECISPSINRAYSGDG